MSNEESTVNPQMQAKKEASMTVALHWTTGGLTIRQYFASKAMNGLISNTEWINYETYQPTNNYEKTKVLAMLSVEIADALIQELNK